MSALWKPTELGEKLDAEAQLRIAAEEAFQLRLAIANYAGAEAARRWNLRDRYWKNGAKNDYREVTDRIKGITSDDESVDLLFNHAARRSTILVDSCLLEIKAIAEQFIRHGTLIGDQVGETFLKPATARCCRLMRW